MQREARTGVTPQLVIGIFIMAMGILLTLDRLNIIDAARTVRFWPTALIALGATIWVRGHDTQGRFWGSVWMFLGSWLLLNTLGLVRIGFWELFWPIVLVLVGLKLVLRTVQGHRAGTTTGTGGVSLFAALAESKRSSDDNPFRGGQMTAIMGGCHLDLRRATIPPGEEAVIDVFALMGGLEIWVPSGWTVIPDVIPILGGVEDKRLLPAAAAQGLDEPEPPPRLVLRGQVALGGLTIKN